MFHIHISIHLSLSAFYQFNQFIGITVRNSQITDEMIMHRKYT